FEHSDTNRSAAKNGGIGDFANFPSSQSILTLLGRYRYSPPPEVGTPERKMLRAASLAVGNQQQ
ncbi:MAG: hypothetical protein KDA59_19300, partial [Planctomycetales bacterium]|nr:hypothetical protein [Planctomycetales bacterium]